MAESSSEREREVLVLNDQGIWGLLNGRESRRAERVESLLARLKSATQGLSTMQDVTLVLHIHGDDPREVKP